MSVATQSKVICDSQQLLNAASCAKAATKSGNSPNEILKCVLGECDGYKLALTGDDGERWLSVDIPCEGEPCRFCVGGDLFLRSVSLMHREKTELRIGEHIELSSQSKKIRVNTSDPENFGHVKGVEGEAFSIDANKLLQGIKCCLPATDTMSTLYALSGVHFTEGEVQATDSRVAVRFLTGTKSHGEFVLPKTSCDLITKSFDEKPTEFVFDGNKVLFSQDGVRVCSRVMEGRFPKLDRVDFEVNYRATVLAGSLLDVCNTAFLMAEENNTAAQWVIKDGSLTVRSPDSTRGRSECSIPVDSPKELDVMLDPQRMASLIRQQPPESNVSLAWADGHSAIQVEISEGHRAFIMPIMRNGE